jgi:hypothetical protein
VRSFVFWSDEEGPRLQPRPFGVTLLDPVEDGQYRWKFIRTSTSVNNSLSEQHLAKEVAYVHFNETTCPEGFQVDLCSAIPSLAERQDHPSPRPRQGSLLFSS